MPSLDLLIPFFLATTVFACVPGPGMLYAMAQTVAGGRDAGWRSAVGLHIGGYAHICASALGLAVLLQTIPALYATVKLAGAAYLIWLGIRFLLSPKAVAGPLATPAGTARDHAIRDSVIVEVLNPKTALFYLAFLPQFTDAAALLPVWGQILVLGVVVNLMFSVTDVLSILLSAGITRHLAASQRASRLARRIGGGILVGLGINLAASRQ